MSSPGQSSGTTKPADLFEDLWRQLGDCHQNALQELEAKVSKLKKDRCLDAQRLEVFYNRNQQLKEQNKTLQDALTLLEERLRTGECDQCVILEEKFKTHQHQNLQLISKLKNEKNSLEDENRKLHTELQKLKVSRSELHKASSQEEEEGIIPDSPILSSSLPVVNRLKKHKNINKNKHVRYAEMPLPKSSNSLFNEINKEPTKNPGRGEVLVPNTCEMDASQISDVNNGGEEVIAETCGFELLDKHPMKMDTSVRQQSSTKTPWKHDAHLKSCCSSPSSTLIHSPDSTTERSPSLLPSVKRFSEDDSICKAKRIKQGSDHEVQEGNKQGTQEGSDKEKEGKHLQPELVNQTSSSATSQSVKKGLMDIKVQSAQTGTSSQRSNVSFISPAFKRPNSLVKKDAGGARQKRSHLQDLNASHGQPEGKPAEKKQTVENMWSLDPAVALSMYDSEWRRDEEMEEEQHHADLADTDCTWVSHSLLQARRDNDKDGEDNVPGLGEKANDSLDMMFDTTAYGEYKSFTSSRGGQSQPCEDDDNEEEDDDEQDLGENSARQSKAQHPTFAHVAVVRKKDERRKLKGTTCKECEIYYAHLPEEEKQKKLSACSRHRFLYIPPCTPENFWEVGFPSTQTCIERGYIKEDKNPQARLRRRQPLTALFSLKQSQQED
ncbi:DNA endonuclease RBBP8 isoform X2 [Amphiprion ocellaris]|uniref:DNA endonuclease RBBP8 isoform X2 n=1 Tax=Amphiprion ocellaris TaxID=80972 RepID=UPI00241166EF|nr:DNA endonuclease RBBP8 isoform X2 [Amphiprion ocellaris]